MHTPGVIAWATVAGILKEHINRIHVHVIGYRVYRVVAMVAMVQVAMVEV